MGKCHMHPQFDSESCVGCALMLAESKIEDHERLIIALREGLQEIYALRGEDEVISSIASPLIERSGLHV